MPIVTMPTSWQGCLFHVQMGRTGLGFSMELRENNHDAGAVDELPDRRQASRLPFRLPLSATHLHPSRIQLLWLKARGRNP
jgi:hypothetical protein